MSSLFVLLLLVSLGLLIWGLAAPKHISRVSKKDMTRKHIALIFGGLSVLFFVLIGITAPAQPGSVHKPDTPAKKIASQSVTPKITTKTEQTTQSIPFASQAQDDSTLGKGQSQTIQQGVAGTETLVYQVTYTNGAETNRKLVSQRTTTQPVPEIVHNGTYVAPPATVSCTSGYINVDGNCVHSPSSDLTGATAQCNDGSYSYSQNHRGTCSHHGGVARWL